jgi:opacity protein-like surface antigen
MKKLLLAAALATAFAAQAGAVDMPKELRNARRASVTA